MGFNPRRITLSTAGLAPRLADLGRSATVNLAVSLNAPDNDTRSKLMPINNTYPLKTLLQACRSYPLPPSRRITFEYILMKGINDSPAHARKLAGRLHGLRAKINLIPFNPHPGSDFQRPSQETIIAFQNVLLERRIRAMIRNSRGDDIAAACGQLRARETKRIVKSTN
jgi:23S rRNA (adenine2503-C2)-methyltransferase